ncbi:NACHT domain-containing protein [Streptomyces sp. DSM 40750]|uniref:NACHT domain-containing protein n=1 Tax=Streptomyces sp. DSM 40750 TaxID=2801030 RepID=UPI00214AFF62|nr:hypothetical protein [Streptomyces sp. DSM 40750]UUU23809.1 hypothetical protein JIX55_28120 [Streptomyces sp. DSM 40750]
MGDVLASWPIGVGGFLLGILALAAKDWLGGKAKLLLDFAYSRLAGSALLRRTALAKYTLALYDRHRRFAVSFQVDEDLKLPMESVYVPLRGARADGAPGELAADLRAERHSVVLGVPGAGKTMLLRHEVLMWARERVRVEDGDGERTGGGGRRRRRRRVDLGEPRDIPVLLELHRLNKAPELPLSQHIVEHFGRHDFPGADKWVRRALERGDLTLYFDGLDEVSTELRPRTADRIKQFTEEYSACRVVVTCRIAVYDGWFADRFGQTLRVRDFDEHLIRRFLNGWPWRAGTAAETARTVDQVLGALRDTPQIMALARNPLLLTMIAYLYDFVYAGTDQVLPHTRAEFYKQVIDNLLIDRRRQSKYPFPLKKAVLQELALVAQDIPSGVHDRLALPHGRVLETVRVVVEQHQRDPAIAQDVLNEIVHRSGLLLAVDNGERYQFAHLTLQEYLAAVALAANPAGLLRRYRTDPAAWRETVRLWCGVESRDCTEVVREVFTRDPVLAFQCLADAHTIEEGAAEEILGHFRAVLQGENDVRDEAVISAFGLVAGDRRTRGRAVFDFLVETVRADPEPGRARAAAFALAATNLPRAAEALAALAEPDNPAWVALVTMGDLAVSAFQERVARYPEAVRALWSIRTPKAALALNDMLWSDPVSPVQRLSAVHLGELLTVPEIAAELSTAPVGRNGAHPEWEWVWRPFARGDGDALLHIGGRITSIIATSIIATPITSGTEPEQWAEPTPDPRIIAALAVIDGPGRIGKGVLLDEVSVGNELADWLRHRQLLQLPGPLGAVSSTGNVSTQTLAQYLEAELDSYSPFVLQEAVGALARAGLAPRRMELVSLLPDWLRMRVAVALLKQNGFAGPQSWNVPSSEAERRNADFSRSPHYRFILFICFALTGGAVWRAWTAATGDQPWGPQWLAVAALVQIGVGWLLPLTMGILTDSGALLTVLFSAPLVFMERGLTQFLALGSAGLLPAICVYSYVAVAQPWGHLAATAVAVLLVVACSAAAVRGMARQRAWEARTHPVCELVLKPLL